MLQGDKMGTKSEEIYCNLHSVFHPTLKTVESTCLQRDKISIHLTLLGFKR